MSDAMLDAGSGYLESPGVPHSVVQPEKFIALFVNEAALRRKATAHPVEGAGLRLTDTRSPMS